MARLTAQAKDGEVSIEIEPDETSASAAKRLTLAIEAAGGLRQPRLTRGERRRQQRQAAQFERRRQLQVAKGPPPDPRHQMMRELGLLECQLCKAWVPATRGAAERHNAICPVERTPN